MKRHTVFTRAILSSFVFLLALSLVFPLNAQVKPLDRDHFLQTVLKNDPAQNARMQVEKLQKTKEAIQEKLEIAEATLRMERAIKEQIPAQEKIRLFILERKQIRARGMEPRAIETPRALAGRFSKGMQTGSISGKVLVNGSVSESEVEVLVFDEYGYPVGSARTYWLDGTYTVPNLPPGSYYVVTNSGYMDEFYNDVPLNDYKNWRNATLVQVADGQAVTGIDFDLQAGALIQGVIREELTGTPLAYNMINIYVYFANDSTEIAFSSTVFTSWDGSYKFYLPKMGQFVIYAESGYLQGEYYSESPDFAHATPITITSPSDTVSNVDFTLAPKSVQPPQPGAAGSVIAGFITAEDTGQPLGGVLVVAFDASDTSIAGFGITGLSGLFLKSSAAVVPDYFITGLDSGSYYVMAVDLIQGYSREFYRESATPDGAVPVTVAENDTVMNVNFTLGRGSGISGTIVNANGDPMEGTLVLAFKASFLNFDPFFWNVDFGFAKVDSTGSYVITGLTEGDYVLRTFSMDSTGMFWLDEWYENVYDLFDAPAATPVTVGASEIVQNVNFTLEPSSGILGKMLDADDNSPVKDVLWVLLFDAQTNKLRFTIFTYTNKTQGEYAVMKVAPGSYYLYALVDPENTNYYISQYYDGVRKRVNATAVDVGPSSMVMNINFTFAKGGVIQGFVYLDNQYSAGADTLYDFPVVAYDATTGEFMGATAVTFTGGYRIAGLPPGSYKIAAIPARPPFATTYFPSAPSFNDANTATVTLNSGDVQDADIQLTKATGVLQGTITDSLGNPLNGILVIVYDETGHAAGAAMSGFYGVSGIPSPNPGVYTVNNLHPGNYYVRTFALFGILAGLADMDETAMNPMQGGGLPDFRSIMESIQVYRDEWYDDVPVPLPKFNVEDLLHFFEKLRYEVFALMPFFQLPPSGATLVNVPDGGAATGIDFQLNEFSVESLPITEVEEEETVTPTGFGLLQSYPNPVSRTQIGQGVSISFQVPQPTQVQIAIYNLLGQKVVTLFQGVVESGIHHVVWNGLDERGQQVPAGIYFYALEANNGEKSMKKLVILR